MAYELSVWGRTVDPERIWATVYQGDEQVAADHFARDLWLEQGIPRHRRVWGAGRNFWKAGEAMRPARRPCSELYYDRGAQHGCGQPDCKPGCDCDRFLGNLSSSWSSGPATA